MHVLYPGMIAALMSYQQLHYSADRVEGNYCGCGTWYEAAVLEIIPQDDGVVVYFVKYTEDGEEETVSAENIRRVAATSLDLSEAFLSSASGEGSAGGGGGGDVGEVSAGSEEEGQPPQNSEVTPYVPKLSIGDDGSLIPELYEGELIACGLS